MTEHPLLLPGDKVRALDAGKTQHRLPIICRHDVVSWSVVERDDGTLWPGYEDRDGEWQWMRSPFGAPGDQLWIRETWMPKNWTNAECAKAGCRDAATHPTETMYGEPTRAIYRASYNTSIGDPGPWKPSIHMPRWAAGIFLRVKRIWVERIQDISEADAIAEGLRTFSCELPPNPPGEFLTYYGLMDYTPQTNEDPVFAFRDLLWNPIYAAKKLGWDVNPWVFACEFEVKK